MPNNYVAEMVMDRIAASKIYNRGNYNQHLPWKYYQKGRDAHLLIHPETKALLEYLLRMLDKKGEDYTFAYIRKYIVGRKEYPRI